uniref:Uncharacterized protein n=2 Tax=Caenorhabditis japonica TaxID=281687 RepID=A0A8R1EE88_CAEJA
MTIKTNFMMVKPPKAEKSQFCLQDRVHIALGSITILLFIGLSSMKCQLQNVFLVLALFEFIMTVLYVSESQFLMYTHFQYQAVVYCVPCFILWAGVYNFIDPLGASEFLKMFHFDLIKDFVKYNSIVWSFAIFALWGIRILLSHKYLVDANTKLRNHDSGPIKQSSLHNSLNCSSVVLFSILAYFSVSTLQNIYMGLVSLRI